MGSNRAVEGLKLPAHLVPLLTTLTLSMLILSMQVEVEEPEAYAFDEEVLKKALELEKPGLVEIQQLQDRFIFRVEGTGVLPVSTAVLRRAEAQPLTVFVATSCGMICQQQDRTVGRWHSLQKQVCCSR